MVCKLVLIGSLWVNTCNVAFLKDDIEKSNWTGKVKDNGCEIYFSADVTHIITNVSVHCEKVAALLNREKASEEAK